MHYTRLFQVVAVIVGVVVFAALFLANGDDPREARRPVDPALSQRAGQQQGQAQLVKELQELDSQLAKYFQEHHEAIADCDSTLDIAKDASSSGSAVSSGYWSGFSSETCRQSRQIMQKINDTVKRKSTILSQLGIRASVRW
jgi:hypothetical protein